MIYGEVRDVPEPVFEIYEDRAGEWRWRLRAPNREIIADSGESYGTKEDCEDGIASVKKNAPIAKIVEMEE